MKIMKCREVKEALYEMAKKARSAGDERGYRALMIAWGMRGLKFSDGDVLPWPEGDSK